MRILIVITNPFCYNFVRGQAKFLTNRKNEVYIMSSYSPEISKFVAEEGAIHIEIPFEKDISILKDIYCLVKIINVVRKIKPDIINAGNPKPGFIFSLAHVFFWKTPLIFTLRGLRSDTLTGIKKQIIKFTEKVTCLFSNKILIISPSLKDHVVNCSITSSNKTKVIGIGSSNGVDLNRFSSDSIFLNNNQNPYEKIINKNSCELIFLYIGRLVKDKGITELVLAFDELSKLYNIKLIIAGPTEKEDPIPSDIYNLINTNKNILKFDNLERPEFLYKLSDVLVLYSYREGFGNVVIEAASMKLPAIVSNIPGLKDTTSHMKTGLIVESRNINLLKDAMIFYINNKDKKVEFGENARIRVEENFSSDFIWKSQLDLYNSISIRKKNKF